MAPSMEPVLTMRPEPAPSVTAPSIAPELTTVELAAASETAPDSVPPLTSRSWVVASAETAYSLVRVPLEMEPKLTTFAVWPPVSLTPVTSPEIVPLLKR